MKIPKFDELEQVVDINQQRADEGERELEKLRAARYKEQAINKISLMLKDAKRKQQYCIAFTPNSIFNPRDNAFRLSVWIEIVNEIASADSGYACNAARNGFDWSSGTGTIIVICMLKKATIESAERFNLKKTFFACVFVSVLSFILFSLSLYGVTHFHDMETHHVFYRCHLDNLTDLFIVTAGTGTLALVFSIVSIILWMVSLRYYKPAHSFLRETIKM